MRAISVAISLVCCFLALALTTGEEVAEANGLESAAIEEPVHFLRGDAMDTATYREPPKGFSLDIAAEKPRIEGSSEKAAQLEEYPPPPGLDLDMTQEWWDSLSKEDQEEYSGLMISKDNREWRLKHWKTKPMPAAPFDVEATKSREATSAEKKGQTPAPPPRKAPRGLRKRGKKANNVVTGQGFPVDINPKANIANDVLSITNYPQESKVVIHLKSNSRCPHPYIVGRLSGPVLVFIGGEDFAFTAPTKRDNSTKLEGHYTAPIGGQFNIELTVIYCDYFLYDHMQTLKSKEWDAKRDVPTLDYDLVKPCTDDAWNMRLTGLGATIHVDPQQAVENPKTADYYGYWWNKNYNQLLEMNNTDSLSTFFRPLLTRFQPVGCEIKGYMEGNLRCVEANNAGPLDDYEWKWTKIGSLVEWKEPLKICYVGGSHAGLLAKYSRSITRLTRGKITFERVDAHYPHLATPDKFNNIGCNKLIIAQVMWPLGHVIRHKGQPAYKRQKLNDYYEEVSKMIQKLKTDPITKDMELYLRSAHMSPLGYFKFSCPVHISVTTPMMSEAYNHVLRRVSQAHGIPFLNASPIVQYPVWDASADWNHLPPKVNQYEGEFYASSITLGLSDSSSN